jgi:hypothetical protein
MQPLRGPRVTIGRIMAVIAALAFLMAIPRLIRSPDLPVAAYLVAVLASLVLLNALAEAVFGLPCPACARWTLRRIARHRGYYRCSACRLRIKRKGLGPWLDASGPEDEGRYRRMSESRPWAGFEVPEGSEETTSGSLLQGKRSRARPGGEMPLPSRAEPGPRLEEARRKVGGALRRWRDMRS